MCVDPWWVGVLFMLWGDRTGARRAVVPTLSVKKKRREKEGRKEEEEEKEKQGLVATCDPFRRRFPNNTTIESVNRPKERELQTPPTSTYTAANTVASSSP